MSMPSTNSFLRLNLSTVSPATTITVIRSPSTLTANSPSAPIVSLLLSLMICWREALMAVCPLISCSAMMVVIIANRPRTLHSTASCSCNVKSYNADQPAASRSISVSVTIVHRQQRQQILSGVFCDHACSNSHFYKTSLELTLQVYTHSITYKQKPIEFKSCSCRTDSSRILNQKPITL